MIKTIYKYQLDIEDRIIIKMPVGSEILSVQTQDEIPCVWALVNPDNAKEERFFEIFGTGNPIGFDMGINRKFIGTFQLRSGALVFHLFERE